MASAIENAGSVLGAAGTGAAVGSVVPGIGTAVGAGVGALVGLGAVLYDELIADGVPPEKAYTVAFQAQQAKTDDFDFLNSISQAQARDAILAGQQDQFIGTLQDQAAGRGVPSLAQMQLARALDQVQSQAAGQMAATRGLNPALAARLVGQQQAEAAQMAAGQAAQLRAQEQIAAQQMLGQTLAGVRGQEQGMFRAGAAGNQAQNALNSQNFNAAQALNAQIAMANAGAEERARERTLGLEQQATMDRRQAVGGLMETGAEALGSGALGGGGKAAGGVIGYEAGGAVEAPKFVLGTPQVPGDSPLNDTVPVDVAGGGVAALSPGEVVIPRSVVTAPDAPDRAAAFVARTKAEALADPAMRRALFGDDAIRPSSIRADKILEHEDARQRDLRRRGADLPPIGTTVVNRTPEESKQIGVLESDLATRDLSAQQARMSEDDLLREALQRLDEQRRRILRIAADRQSDVLFESGRNLDDYFDLAAFELPSTAR